MAKARSAKSPSKTPMRVPAHGRGALRVGGTNRGGSGRPPSVIREQLRGTIAERAGMLEQIMDGVPLQRTRVEVGLLAPFVECTKCGESTIRPKGAAAGIEIEAIVSASPKERIAAYDTAAKYGLGALKEVSIENVRERVMATLEVIRQHCPAQQATTIVNALRPIWA